MLPGFPKPSLMRALGRGVRRRCPRCGSAAAFSRWWKMSDDCPVCGLHFEYADGYWLGAVVLNLVVTEAIFLVVFIGGMVLTWPDVPWGWLLAVVIGTNVVVPVLFYPIAKTLWVAMERHARRWDG